MLSRLGVDYRRAGAGYQFRIPWRTDRHPSGTFFLSRSGQWFWKDHALLEGGDVENFLTRLGYSRSEARRFLVDLDGSPSVVSSSPKPRPVSETRQERRQERPAEPQYRVEAWPFSRIQEVPEEGRRLLRRYMREWRSNRGFSWEDLRDHAYLVRIERSGARSIWKLGFRNRSGGFELLDLHLRPGCRKMSVGQKDISIFPGRGKRIFVTESVLDAVALRKALGEIPVIALNGTGLASRAVEFIEEKVLRDWKVILALDNDPPGQEATQRIAQDLSWDGFEVEELRYVGKDPSAGWKEYGPDFVRPAPEPEREEDYGPAPTPGF